MYYTYKSISTYLGNLFTCQCQVALEDPGDAWAHADLGSLREMLLLAAKDGKFSPDPMVPFDIKPNENAFANFTRCYF